MNYERVTKHYGADHQLLKTAEELSELEREILGFLQGEQSRLANIIEEIADVEIMLSQVKYIFQCEKAVKDMTFKKLLRLNARIDEQIANGITWKNNKPYSEEEGCQVEIQERSNDISHNS